MNDRVLNLLSIRDHLTPHTPLLFPRLTALLEAATQAKLSRRTLLKMLGTALPVPAALTASGEIFHTFQISNEHGRIAFIVGGIERWVIDPNSFIGDPQTRLTRRKNGIEVQLSNAVFPGTGISASFASRLRRVADGWMMDFKADFGDFETSVDFLKWLQGLATARSALKLSSGASFVNDAFRVDLKGNALGEFHPRWHWLLSGQQIGAFQGLGATVHSDRVVLALPDKRESSLLHTKPSKRTIIGFDRGNHLWNFKPPVASSRNDDDDEWSLTDLDDLFDRLTIETAAQEGRETTIAVFADAPERVTQTTLSPSTVLADEDDGPFRVALENPRLAAVPTERGIESAFMADYTPRTARAFGPGYSMSLRTTSQGGPFEVVSLDDKLENVEFNPEVLDVHAPVQGAITEPCVPLPDGDVDLPATEHSSRKWWKVWFWPPNWGNGAKCLKMGMLPPVTVIRPEDLLVLEFSFTNIVLEKGEDGIPRLIVPKDSATPGIVQVNFPPQSITEQAFFQTSDEFKLKVDGVCMPPRSEGVRECDPDADKTDGEDPSEPPVAARMAGPSQLVFELKSGEYLDYTIEGLLDWSKLTARLVPGADGPKPELKPPYIINPLSTQPDVPGFTALEMPYRLYLSPNSRGAWKHRKNPVATDENRVELWHTRLGTRINADNPDLPEEVDEKSAQDRTVRAIWSYDYTASANPEQPCGVPPDNKPFRMSLSKCDRHEIVRLTSDYLIDDIDACQKANPQVQRHVLPVQVNQLMLSSLGSFMNLRGAWEPPKFMRVEEWINRTTMARDHYVKVVYKGYLFPLGHRASLIKVTERKFEYVPNATDPTKGDYVAYLRQRMFIVVRERIKFYPALGQPFSGRHFSFDRIEFAERDSVTPDLDEPVSIGPKPEFYNFWPSVHHTCYNFRFTGWDAEGPKHLTAPLIFVDNIIAHDALLLEHIFREYEKVEGTAVACVVPPAPNPTPSGSAVPSPTPTPSLPSSATPPGATRYINVCGEPIAYAPSRKSGDTSFPTEDIKLAADEPDASDAVKDALKCADQPPFYPGLEFASVHVPAVEEFTGKTEVRDIRFPKAYLEHGFDLSANAAEIFAEMLTAPDPNARRNPNREPLYLNFGGPTGGNGDRSGGLSTPNQRVVGLSRRIGLVGGSVKGNGAGGGAHHAGAMLLPPALPGANEALEKALRGEFDPFDFFGGALSEAKLLGVVKLADIIKVVLNTAIGNLGDAPKLVRNTIYKAGAALDGVLGPMVAGIERIVSRIASADIPDQLKQRLQPSLQELRNASTELSKVKTLIDQANATNDVKKLEEARLAGIGAVGHAVQAGKQLVDECKRVANDPLAALGLTPTVLTELKTRFTTVLNEVRGLIKDALLEAIRAEIQRALTAFQAALDASGFDEDKKRYIEQIEAEISSVKDRIESTLADLQKELRNASDILTANLGPIVSLAAQFLKDAYELRDRYEQLKDALRGNVSTVAPALNSLLKLKVVEDAVGADRLAKLRSLETTFQTSRRDFENAWKVVRDAIDGVGGPGIAAVNGNILTELRAKGESLYARAQVALRSIHDLPDSATRKAELEKFGNDITKIQTIVDDYTKQFSHGLLGAQREFVDLLVQFDKLAEELRAQGIDTTALKTFLETIGKQYTVVGKYFDDFADPATLVQAVADLLPGKLKDDVVKKRDELVQLVSGPFLENGLKAIDKLDEIRQRATYDFLMAGSAMAQQAAPFINAYTALNDQLNEYERQVKTAAGTLKTALMTFESGVPDLLRPAVATLLTQLISDLDDFSTRGTIEDLPRLMQTFLRLRDQIVGVFTNPVDQLQKLIDVQKVIEGFVKEFGLPTQIALSFDWKPPVQTPSWPIFETMDGCEFLIRADALIDLRKPAPPAFNITGRLTNFRLNLLPNPNFINLIFDKVEFKSQNGGPLAVDVKIQKIEFGQSLEFVKKLAEILNPKSGPFLDIQPTHITAGFRFGWPMIPVGGMVMYGLNLFAGITLPFTGDPMRLRLGVSDQARPFLLAVGVYAGGGFLTLDMDASGIQKVQGALEFGAHVELNFFEVAKGHGSVMAGFFFGSERLYKQSGEAYTATTLCGYVRASGELSIIGLISVSLDILVQVCYVSAPPRVYGRATVKVEISILFFSATVEVTAEYTFAGGGSGPPSHHAVADRQKQALPGAGSPEATHDPILSTAFRWEEFQRAFHD